MTEQKKPFHGHKKHKPHNGGNPKKPVKAKKPDMFKAYHPDDKNLEIECRWPTNATELQALLDDFQQGKIVFGRMHLIRGYWMRKHKAIREFLPLCVGVHEQLLTDARQQDGDTPYLHLFKAAIRLHTSSPRYLTTMLSKKRRYNLDGSNSDLLTKQEKHHAVELMETAMKSVAEHPQRYKPIKQEYLNILAKYKERTGMSVPTPSPVEPS